MGVVDILTQGLEAPRSAFLFERPDYAVSKEVTRSRAINSFRDTIHLQYWPQSLQDDYQVEWAEHSIPGGSHPLYQWIGGRGRTISFEAIFTAEINEDSFVGGASGSVPLLTPSAVYTVDVAAGLSKIRGWMRPSYGSNGRLGLSNPPPVLVLSLENSHLNGESDQVDVILRSAPITIESWYPDGKIRVATVALTFNEIVQKSGGSGKGSTVTFIDRKSFVEHGKSYKRHGIGGSFATGGI